MYEEHNLKVVTFDNSDVFADWDGSIIDGDAEDQWSLKPNRSDI